MYNKRVLWYQLTCASLPCIALVSVQIQGQPLILLIHFPVSTRIHIEEAASVYTINKD